MTPKEVMKIARKRAWSPEARAKRAATRAANKAANAETGDAIIYLRHAAEDILSQMRAGTITLKSLRSSHALTLLALCQLERR